MLRGLSRPAIALENPVEVVVRWFALPATAFVAREWAGEWVVLNTRTGSTHLLNELAGDVLIALAGCASGATTEELTTLLAPSVPLADNAANVEAVARVLDEFEGLDLASQGPI